MKNKLIHSAFLSLILPCSISHAFGDAVVLSPTPTPSSPVVTKNEIGAQMNVIRSGIEDAIRKIESRKVDTRFKMSDYWRELPVFKKEVAAVLDEFRIELGDERHGLLGEVALLLERYNSIYLSSTFTEEQKTVLLKGALQHIEERTPILKNRYVALIQRAFERIFKQAPISTPYLSHQANTNSTAEQRKSKEIMTEAGCAFSVGKKWKRSDQNFFGKMDLLNFGGEKFDHKTLCAFIGSSGKYYKNFEAAEKGTHPFSDPKIMIKQQIYNQYFFPIISKGCQSEICLGMRSGDLIFVLQLMKSTLNRELNFQVASKTHSIQFQSLNFKTDEMIEYLSNPIYPVKLPYDTP